MVIGDLWQRWSGVDLQNGCERRKKRWMEVESVDDWQTERDYVVVKDWEGKFLDGVTAEA